MEPLEFCRIMSKQSIENKQKSIDKLNKALSNKEFSEKEIPYIKAMISWLGVSQVVGHDLCPPESFPTFLVQQL